MRRLFELQTLLRIVTRAALSLLAGAVLYTLWLGLFLTLSDLELKVVNALLWLLAPAFTAAGFAGMIVLIDRSQQQEDSAFFSIYLWCLVGCIAGALAVFWAGPMLIVFGMLGMGTVGVVVREVYLLSSREADLSSSE